MRLLTSVHEPSFFAICVPPDTSSYRSSTYVAVPRDDRKLCKETRQAVGGDLDEKSPCRTPLHRVQPMVEGLDASNRPANRGAYLIKMPSRAKVHGAQKLVRASVAAVSVRPPAGPPRHDRSSAARLAGPWAKPPGRAVQFDAWAPASTPRSSCTRQRGARPRAIEFSARPPSAGPLQPSAASSPGWPPQAASACPSGLTRPPICLDERAGRPGVTLP